MLRFKKLAIGILAMMVMMTIVGCTTAEDEKQSSFAIKDASGVTVKVKKDLQKIVSIAPSTTEILFALGLGDKIVGVTEFCDYPEEAKKKKTIGDLNANIEAIVSLEPDLIVGGYTLNKDAVNKLRELGQTVLTVEPKNIDQVLESIELLGSISGTESKAQEITEKMKAERKQVIDAVEVVKAARKAKVYFEFDPLWTVGKGEFGNDLLELANATNISSSLSGWVQIDDEFVVKANPDVILYSNYTPKDLSGIQAIMKRNGWESINAIKNKRVVSIDASLVSRPGPRITQGLLEVAKGVYPELVK